MLTAIVIIHNSFRAPEMVFSDVVVGQVRDLVGLGLALTFIHASRGAKLHHTTQLACDLQADSVDDEIEPPNAVPASDELKGFEICVPSRASCRGLVAAE